MTRLPRLSREARKDGGSGRSRSTGGRSGAKATTKAAPAGGVLTADRPAPDVRPRRAPQQVRRWPWILGAALTATLLVAAGVVIFFTPLLGLRSVVITAGSITGADGAAVAGGTLDPSLDAAVRAVVDVPDGTPLARIDLGGIAERVRDVPQVDAVSVGRSWPNAVTVTITPRVPVAVTSANGQLWLMDRQGVAYLPVAAAPAGLVTLKLATPGPGDPATEAAMTVIESFTDSFRGQVAAVSARTAYDVQLTLTDGRTVVWGGADQSARKMQVLPTLLEQKGSQYDVTDPSLVSVR
ncbi:FtsQ-type POTRA domain-containing protein [Nakamurella flava]|uniref:FtsQ-type POTRA domain-containing protein n=1 Tax=Nakamurella flava TaxID=2576308 RepID=A0A4V6CR51_9ACTN|nr:FtsQ-type POTRA domain-containing protein [Nakamurella flava]TKV56085.1 FtsQ-type POTRA domain-containing protein [Nakamurella flava]